MQATQVDFTPPPGAKPFVPGGRPTTVDPSHTVPNLDSAPPLFDAEPQAVGPKIGGRLDLGAAAPKETAEPTPAPSDAAPVDAAPGPLLCPHCGWDVHSKVRLDIPDAGDKRAWISHVLGEPHFRKTFTLYGGEVEVTVRSRLSTEDDAVFTQLNADVKSGIIPDTQPLFLNLEYGHRMHSYFMGFSIERIASKSGKVTYEQKKTEGTPDVSGTLDQLKKGITDGLFMNLIELQRKFEAMTRILITRGSDPNFWGPTAG